MSEYLFRTKNPIMFCQECPMVKKIGLSTICPLREGAERKYGTCPLEEVPTHGDWHTGRPTEEGWYFCLVDTGVETKYMANEWKDIAGYQWVYGFLGEIIAWRKEEDPIKILNEAKLDFVK